MRFFIYFIFLLTSISLFANEHNAHHGIDWNILGGSIFNFFLLITLLVIFTKKPIKEALKKRKEEMEAMINKYKTEKEEAEKKLKEYEEKLSNLSSQIDEIKKNYEKASKLKEEALIKQNEENIKKLKANYERELETKMQLLHNELKNELMNNAIRISEELIVDKFTKDSKSEQEFIKKFKIS